MACSNETQEDPLSKDEKEEAIEIQIPKEPEHYAVSISAIGDILAHNSVYEDAQIAPNKYDFTKMFTQVKPYLERTDITVANSESMVGGQDIGVSTYPNFNSPYELADILKNVGVDVVNLANNHTLDRGEQAIINATKHWNELGMKYVGASTSFEEAKEIKTLTVNNINFSFLGYTYGTNGIPIPKGKEYLVNLIDEQKMVDDIALAKEISDVVVLNLHIGDEYARDFNEYQDRIAQLASDNGVDIIFAHHSHVLQPVKWYEGTYGNKTFVIHSLGNFLSAQDKLYRQIGAILELDVSKTVEFDAEGNETISIDILNPRLLPTYVKFKNWANFEIIPMYKLTNNDLNNAQGIYQEMKKHMSKYVADLQFIEE